jgi:phage protein U
VGGGGTYTVQLAQGAHVLNATPQEVDMESDLFLMDSMGDIASTWVKSRAQSLDSAFAPQGTPVVMEFTSTRTDWYGLVIIREGVSGTYDLTRTTL